MLLFRLQSLLYLSANVARTNVTCNGANDGTITITNPMGGYGTYEYQLMEVAVGSWQIFSTVLLPAHMMYRIRDAANTGMRNNS